MPPLITEWPAMVASRTSFVVAQLQTRARIADRRSVDLMAVRRADAEDPAPRAEQTEPVGDGPITIALEVAIVEELDEPELVVPHRRCARDAGQRIEARGLE